MAPILSRPQCVNMSAYWFQAVPKTIELTGHFGQWQALIYWPKTGFTGPNNWHNTMSRKFPHASRASGRAVFTGPIGNWLANGVGPVLISQTVIPMLTRALSEVGYVILTCTQVPLSHTCDSQIALNDTGFTDLSHLMIFCYRTPHIHDIGTMVLLAKICRFGHFNAMAFFNHVYFIPQEERPPHN